MPRFRLSRRATQDIQSIYRHGHQNWGRDQAVAYAAQLRQCFTMLASHPQAGRVRPELQPPDLRSFVQGSHVVFYLPDSDGVLIVRVLHGHHDVTAILTEKNDAL